VAKKYLNSPQPKIIPYKQDPRIVPNHQNKLVKIRAQNENLKDTLNMIIPCYLIISLTDTAANIFNICVTRTLICATIDLSKQAGAITSHSSII
jgi:hypothetical protein